MAYEMFPTLPSGNQMDSSKYEVDPEDPAQESSMEGGYVVTRAKHTRTPRLTFKCGYTWLDDADKQTLLDFWNLTRGRSTIFEWVNPEDGKNYFVRFKDKMKFTYVGRGTNKRWDVGFSLEQA